MHKPTIAINHQLNCGEIKFKSESILCDTDDMVTLTNANVQTREKAINELFKFNPDIDSIDFTNDDVNDLRRENVEIKPLQKYAHLMEAYTIHQYIGGHKTEMGSYANRLKNPKWHATDENDNEVVIMYCESNTICILCPKSHQIVLDFEKMHGKKITWYCGANNYIIGRLSEHKLLYIHQIITGCHGNGNGTRNISVDHINRNPLDNRFDNLRIASRKQQEANSAGIMPNTKRNRQSGARPLPDGITQDMLKKYVVYYVGYLNADRTKWRDFFEVEGHPALGGKTWTTTKSMKVSAYQKLMDANKVVDDLDNGIMPATSKTIATTKITFDETTQQPKEITDTVILPKYIRISNARGKPHLELDKRNGSRISLKMILPENYDITVELDRFIQKVITKYPDLSSLFLSNPDKIEPKRI